jgi:Protein of unknown function (DUF2855)
MSIEILNFEVRKDNLRQTQLHRETIDPAALAASGKAVLAINHFALTANNITYATFGEEMSYWAFFPGSDGYGHIPVWGYADVVASGAPDLPVGERVYGYFPMASHLVVEPVKVSPKRFIDGAAHRSKLPAVYNAYERIAADPGYSVAREPAQMILRPLVVTSFLIADFLADNAFFGAKQVAVSSASSKTSLGLGFCLRRLANADLKTIALTSSGNKAFVEKVGTFDRTVTYDDIANLDPSVPTAYVDMAGSADLLTRVHGRFQANLVHSCRVGATHWQDRAKKMDLPGAQPKFFFAPAQVQKRLADWGPGGLEKRFAGDWMAMLGTVDQWLTVDQRHGPAAMATAYHDTLEGRVSPSTGLVLSLASV